MFKKRSVLGSNATGQQRVKKRPLEEDGNKTSSEESSSSDGDSDSDGEAPVLKSTTFKRRMINPDQRKLNVLSSRSVQSEDTINSTKASPVEEDKKIESTTKSKDADITADTYSEQLIREDREKRKQDLENLKSKGSQSKDSQGNKLYTGNLNNIKDQSTLKLKGRSTNIKTTTVMDFQADVCKDFLKNGYCGFGDTCKFLHYRDEFKVVKNQKPREWEDVLKKRGKKW